MTVFSNLYRIGIYPLLFLYKSFMSDFVLHKGGKLEQTAPTFDPVRDVARYPHSKNKENNDAAKCKQKYVAVIVMTVLVVVAVAFVVITD